MLLLLLFLFLFRDTVTTYTPQNVKSIGCSYGSGNSNTFSADVVVDSQEYSEIKTVTDYSFFGFKDLLSLNLLVSVQMLLMQYNKEI